MLIHWGRSPMILDSNSERLLKMIRIIGKRLTDIPNTSS